MGTAEARTWQGRAGRAGLRRTGPLNQALRASGQNHPKDGENTGRNAPLIVGQKKAHTWRLLDILGDVWNWTANQFR